MAVYMLRAARFEAGLFSACLNECLESSGPAGFPLHEDITHGIEVTPAENRNYRLADGFFRLARQSNGMQLFLRYQAQAEGLYPRAVKEFERLKKLRPELPNEPIPARGQTNLSQGAAVAPRRHIRPGFRPRVFEPGPWLLVPGPTKFVGP